MYALILSPNSIPCSSAYRFVDCEKWRREFGVDNLVRNFDYKEKPKVFEYYPQYYHKTDKVATRQGPGSLTNANNPSRTVDQSTSNN